MSGKKRIADDLSIYTPTLDELAQELQKTAHLRTCMCNLLSRAELSRSDFNEVTPRKVVSSGTRDTDFVSNCAQNGSTGVCLEGSDFKEERALSQGALLYSPMVESSRQFRLTAGCFAALVACRSEFVTAEAARGVRVFPLNGPSIGGVGVDVATEFAS